MTLFEAVKQSFTTKQAAEHYHFRASRSGFISCPFHNDRTPSMKVDNRFHCFGCGADGDVIDFVARLNNLNAKSAAEKLAADFRIPYEKTGWRPKAIQPAQKTNEELQYQKFESRCFRVLSDYLHLLRQWEGTTHPSQRTKCGIRFLWKPCKRRTISNTCWMCCSANPCQSEQR